MSYNDNPGRGERNDNEENGSDSTPHYASIGKEPGLHIHILGMKLSIVITNSCFRPKTNMNLFPAHQPGEIFFVSNRPQTSIFSFSSTFLDSHHAVIFFQ